MLVIEVKEEHNQVFKEYQVYFEGGRTHLIALEIDLQVLDVLIHSLSGR